MTAATKPPVKPFDDMIVRGAKAMYQSFHGEAILAGGWEGDIQYRRDRYCTAFASGILPMLPVSENVVEAATDAYQDALSQSEGDRESALIAAIEAAIRAIAGGG